MLFSSRIDVAGHSVVEFTELFASGTPKAKGRFIGATNDF
jgi:hypothetical protein